MKLPFKDIVNQAFKDISFSLYSSKVKEKKKEYTLNVMCLEWYRSLLDVLVGLDSQDAVHDSVAIDVGDGAGSGFRIVVFDDGRIEVPSEVILLDQALLHRSLSREKFLNRSYNT